MGLSKMAILVLAILVITSVSLLYMVVGKKQEEANMDDHDSHMAVPSELSELKNPIPSTDESIRRGKERYIEYCQRCHGLYGKGDGPDAVGFPIFPKDLTDKERMSHHSDGDYFNCITYGMEKEELMPPFGENLTESERWDLVNYLKTFY